MFTLSCPACQTALSLDDGYRGMTCRCSACTSLIAIPNDPMSQPAQVIRAGRPEAPGRPATPQQSGYHAAPAQPHQSGTGYGQPHVQPHASGMPPQQGSGWQQQQPVPPHLAAAPAGGPALVSIKRGGEEAAGKSGGGLSKNTLLIGALATPAALVLILLVVFLVLKGSPDAAQAGNTPGSEPVTGTTDETDRTSVSFGPSPDNLLTAIKNKPTVLGLPLGRHTAIFVDAGDLSREWFGLFQESLQETLQRQSAARVSLFYLSDGRVIEPSRQEIQPGRLLAAAVRDMDRNVNPVGKTGFWDATEAVVASGAEHVILVTARTKWSRSVEGLTARLKRGERPISFDVISFGGNNRDLREVAENFSGSLKVVEPADLRRWLREVAKAG